MMEQQQLFLSYPEVRKVKDAAIAQVADNAEEWISGDWTASGSQ